YMSQKKHLFSLLLLLLASYSSFSQVLPVGTPVLEDKYRRDQLLGLVDSSISFVIRPLTATALDRTNLFDPMGAADSVNYIYGDPREGLTVQLLPARFQYQL